MSWDGVEKRKNGGKDHDLLTQIDTKLTILLDNFDKHIEEDKVNFKSLNDKTNGLQMKFGIGIGMFIAADYLLRFFLK